MSRFEPVFAGGIVVVRTNRLRNSPVRHCQLGIKLGSTLERTSRFVMIEGVDQPQALIEELLRLRILCRNRVMQIAQARHQRGRLGLRRHGMVLCDSSDCNQTGEQASN